VCNNGSASSVPSVAAVAAQVESMLSKAIATSGRWGHVVLWPTQGPLKVCVTITYNYSIIPF
jgi:hypothetical protein